MPRKKGSKNIAPTMKKRFCGTRYFDEQYELIQKALKISGENSVDFNRNANIERAEKIIEIDYMIKCIKQ